ncbi:hypothetical protein CRUP_026855 [Coryphaenoides rupestris]|nr:hypothetical protein CRUP_026855 [Coryphaenoides rupestris]
MASPALTWSGLTWYDLAWSGLTCSQLRGRLPVDRTQRERRDVSTVTEPAPRGASRPDPSAAAEPRGRARAAWTRRAPDHLLEGLLGRGVKQPGPSLGSFISTLRTHPGGQRPRTKDDLRAYLILLQNPQFSLSSTYVIFAHLLRQTSSLSDADHHYLIHWLTKVPPRRFGQLVQRLLHLISTYAANSVASPAIISFTDFYSLALEHVDIMEQYRLWQHHGNADKFSFCQYPFILSAVVKKEIIQRDSELQMLREARHSVVSKVSRRQRVDMNILFLNIKVRRSQLLHDSLEEYEGYTKTDPTIRDIPVPPRCFWEVVMALPLEMQKKLLHFATGSDRVPVGGLANLNFKISKIDVSTDWLPISHTCFNQICLPPYRSRKELKHKLTIAISNAEGFGLE